MPNTLIRDKTLTTTTTKVLTTTNPSATASSAANSSSSAGSTAAGITTIVLLFLVVAGIGFCIYKKCCANRRSKGGAGEMKGGEYGAGFATGAPSAQGRYARPGAYRGHEEGGMVQSM